MKFYETHYEEYIQSVEKYNIHPELSAVFAKLPPSLSKLENLIIYGPSGVGKYSQVLALLKKYSPSSLKYDKKIRAQTEKQDYIYRISDIHYEIDMSLLGCNPKIVWHEIFNQIVDIVSVKTGVKCGVIVCKNFHTIHNELLEIFYSYIQQYHHIHSNISIKFIIMTEHISFIPNNILNCCETISVGRPSKEQYANMVLRGASEIKQIPTLDHVQLFANKMAKSAATDLENVFISFNDFTPPALAKPSKNVSFTKINNMLENIETEHIINGKEIRSFSMLDSSDNLPKDIFNIICSQIIGEIDNYEAMSFTTFRDTLYDILVYNLDAVECLWFVLFHYIQLGSLKSADISAVLDKTYTFLHYYNNNYRPIYHLESIFFYLLIKIHGL